MTKCEKKCYEPHKLRSHPWRCFLLPLYIVLLFIIYWFLLCPVIFYAMFKSTAFNPLVNWTFWLNALLAFIIILMALICIWRKNKKSLKSENIVSRQTEYNTILRQSNLDDIELEDLRKSQENTYRKSQYRISLIQEEVGKETEDFEPKEHDDDGLDLNEYLREKDKCDIVTDDFCAREVKPETVNENIDKIFPRCSTKKKRPNTLHTTVKLEKAEIKSLSPLSARESFFFDLRKSADAATKSATNVFLEHEKRLSQAYEPQSPTQTAEDIEKEYFIMNVVKSPCETSEAFIFVDTKDSSAATEQIVVELDTGTAPDVLDACMD